MSARAFGSIGGAFLLSLAIIISTALALRGWVL